MTVGLGLRELRRFAPATDALEPRRKRPGTDRSEMRVESGIGS